MKFGIGLIPHSNFEKTIQLVKLAEKSGFKYAWINDNPHLDTYKLLRKTAYETESIKIGYGVTNPYIKKPEEIASEMININHMHENRTVIGIGPANKEMLNKLKIPWTNPISKIKKAINIINETTNNKIPIYLDAQSPKLLNMAGENTDGALITASHPKDYEELLPHIKKENKSLKFDVASYTPTSVDKDFKIAQDAARIVVAFIIAGSKLHVLERHEIHPKTSSEIYTNLCKGNFAKAIRLVDNDMLNKFSISGTVDDVISKINNLKDVGVTQFIVSSPIGKNIEESIKLFSEVIASF